MILLTGNTSAHGELFGMENQLRAEVLALAAAIGPERLWIEKVRIDTSAVDVSEAIKVRADALADLQTLLESAETDPDFIKILQEELLPLVNKAPLELQSSVPYFGDIRVGDVAGLVREARSGLLAYLANVE